jgi:lipoate-protein ligase A
MALDHALRDLADHDGTSVLRLYRWSTNTISFGANEAANRHWSRSAIEAAAMPVVRRPSGGRAVWHDADDLTYAITGPLSPFGGVQAAYHSIHQRLAAALGRLGVVATLAPAPPRLPGLRRGACFDVAVGGEVLVEATKVIGSAQVITRETLLQHGAIARADHSAQLAAFELRESLDVSRPLTPTSSILPEVTSIGAAIAAEWSAAGAVPIELELTERANAATVQYIGRYRDPLWTWRR